MNTTRLAALGGVLEILWCDAGRVRQLRWISGAQGALTTEPDFYATLAAPTAVRELVRSLQRFLTTGEPLEGSRTQWWDAVDRSEWTPFQRAVADAVCRIPMGETRTYAWVAHQIRKPLAMRAVGQALRRNPVLLLVPCHRVVSVRSLGGFMGFDKAEAPEVKVKEALLRLEYDFRNPVFSFLLDARTTAA